MDIREAGVVLVDGDNNNNINDDGGGDNDDADNDDDDDADNDDDNDDNDNDDGNNDDGNDDGGDDNDGGDNDGGEDDGGDNDDNDGDNDNVKKRKIKSSTLKKVYEPKIAGTAKFFTFKTDGSLSCHPITGRRVNPHDFGYDVPIIMELHNYQQIKSKCRGSSCVVYQRFRWHLYFIWEMEYDYFIGYQSDQFHNLVEKKVEFDNATLFHFVSLFNFGDHIRCPAEINVIDGKLDGGCKPSHCWLPKPSLLLPEVTSPSTSVPPCKKKRRGLRGRRKGSVPWFLRPESTGPMTLCLFLDKEALSSCPLNSHARQTLQDGEPPRFLFRFPPDQPDPEHLSTVSYIRLTKNEIEWCDTKSFPAINERFQSYETIQLIYLEHTVVPVRLFICSTVEHSDLQQKPFVTQMKVGCTTVLRMFSDHPSTSLPGCLCSVWSCEEEIASMFTYKDVTCAQSRFGSFFGSRPSVPSCGMNGYLGPRRSTMPNLSPTVGPGKVAAADYYRGVYANDELHFLLQKKISNAASAVLATAKKFNGSYLGFCGDRTCDRVIYTQGVFFRKHKRLAANGMVSTIRSSSDKFYGFFNKPHCDSVDEVDDYDWFDSKLVGINNNHITSKLKQMKEDFGFGLTTTCGYNLVHGPANQYEPKLLAEFAYGCFVSPIHNGSVHHMAAWIIPHCTVAPHARFKGCVLTQNTEEFQAYVVGWGSSGGSAQVGAARNRRENRRRTRSQS